MPDIVDTPRLDFKIAVEKLSAESEQLKSATRELLSTSTQGERDRLLLVSLLCLAVGAAGYTQVPPGVANPLEGLNASNAWSLPAGLALIQLYFLVSLCINGCADRNRWRTLVRPEWHTYGLKLSDIARERERVLEEELAKIGKVAALVQQLNGLRDKKYDTIAERRKSLASHIDDLTPDEYNECLGIGGRAPDTSALDAEIERIEKLIEVEKSNQKQPEEIRALPMLDASTASTTKRYWRIQNLWQLVVPISIGLFSEVIITLKLYRVLFN